jgi:RNA polymerase sigma-70 factor (ECF subfamily)
MVGRTPPEPTDEELALQARREPRAAFTVLFERYREALYAFLWRQGAEACRIDDLFQMVFLKAYRAIPQFREEARFKTWLYAIAINVLYDDRRADQRRRPPAPLEEDVVAADPPQGTLEGSEVAGRVRAALARMSASHRQLFTLVRFQGLTIAEAAPLVGMTPAAAKVTLFRTSKRIGELLTLVRENP